MSSPDVNKALKIASGAVATVGLLNYVYPYWGHDWRTLRFGWRFKAALNSLMERKHYVVDIFEEQAKKQPYKTFVIHNNTIYTYGDIDRMSNQFANFVRRQGLKRGDTVAMFMYNEPAYLWMYFGFAKLGISCAFINYNLRGEAIIHCLDVTGAKLLVVGHERELVFAVVDIKDQLAATKIDVLSFNGDNESYIKDVTQELLKSPAEPISKDERIDVCKDDVSVYIFTSGTTGHPKAVNITYTSHVISCFLMMDLDVQRNDRIYNCLPLYHSAGFMLAFGLALNRGITMILAKKFSVHNFWDDCRRHNASIFMYVGELCRYLLTLPETPHDKNHSVRMAIGNGLRPDIWTKFQQRFRIPKIAEFYAATDGTFYGINTDNKIGAVGKFSPLTKRLIGFHLVKYDFETAQPIRGKDGRCINVGIGEVGLLLSPVTRKYPGYSRNEEATEKKLVRNAFKDGDVYCNMGDLMRLDKNYYIYFVDRIGDTFRWKGENVSTMEVAEVIGQYPNIEEVNVYGVKIPGHDGRAGMVALVPKNEETFDPKEFYNHVTSSLPKYACPKFLRIMEKLETTGTFKYKKGDLVEEAFNPNEVKEKMYYIDDSGRTYKHLNKAAYLHILAGKAKL
ncbi:long-chain fatty acid transport protein 2-like isoform X2 [Ptychodera flava]|uniref:long-chain fatty acid transport protein 2-like isoform X2 n=1 Tax=Ptychodera flava TaxID=63121 RepID=UPI003969C44D